MICFVLLCAHAHYLEKWHGLPGLYAMFGLGVGSVLVLAWRLQRAAQNVRAELISRCQVHIAEALWIKRLVLQRADFAYLPDPRGSVRELWSYTLARLGAHLSPPETPRTLTVLQELPGRGSGFGVAELDRDLEDARRRDVAFQDARVARLERLITLATEMKDGAFGGWHSHPIFRSLLLPGAGFGSLRLLERVLLG